MIGGESLTLSVDAARLVGTVLLEAIALYVGYGALERVVGRRMIETITNY